MNKNLELEHLFRNYLQKCKSTSLFIVLMSLIMKTLKAQNPSLSLLNYMFLKPDLFQNNSGVLICAVFNFGCKFWNPCYTINLYDTHVVQLICMTLELLLNP